MKNLARKLLPTRSKQILRGLLGKWDVFLTRCFSTAWVLAHPRLASLFYAFFSSQFDREHLAILAGKKAYRYKLGPSNTSPLLRRNIHRIEKGLCMSPMRPVFAEDFIVETVNCFVQLQSQQQVCQTELTWANDVLKAYFSVVSSTPITDQARVIFAQQAAFYPEPDPLDVVNIASHTPYARHLGHHSDVSVEQFHSLCLQRRSVRWFLPQSVDDELLNQAIMTASFAPSACNRQPFSFYVANDATLAAEVASFAGGTRGFADNIPCLLVVVGDLSAYPSERDRHVIYIDGALAAMQLMLALETLGLSSCPINWPDLDVPEQRMAKKLNLLPFQRPVMLLAVGYAKPDGMIPYSQKKTVDVLRKDIK